MQILCTYAHRATASRADPGVGSLSIKFSHVLLTVLSPRVIVVPVVAITNW